MVTEYRAFLDEGRSPALAVSFMADHAPGFERVDPLVDEPKVQAGQRLVFVDNDRTAIFVIVGEQPVADAGVRLIGAHIDTPSPRLDTANLTRSGQTKLKAYGYGGFRPHHWSHRALAVVGHVAPVGRPAIRIELGLTDDFALFSTEVDKKKWEITVVTSSTPTELEEGGAPVTLVDELHRRYGLTASDLRAAELYVVPKAGSREVGFDRELIGSHGQDDRANSYAAWRGIVDVQGTPSTTAMSWLVDREEIGSSGRPGARSRFLELVVSWLMEAQGNNTTEATMSRAMAASVVLSADTPACQNPNFPEVHEPKHGPVMGHGPAIFPFTGRGGKKGGSAAHAERVASLMRSLEGTGVPFQHGELGKVDEGGGGTISKYLAHRGMDVIDIGVCVVSMHSPFELASKDDLWSAYRGFRAWLGKRTK
jgi:aspartyl aminopeptidase